LDARLARGTIARIHGAAHGAHHTHPEAFVVAVEAFLDADPEDLHGGGPA
jgi:hypothetical protein